MRLPLLLLSALPAAAAVQPVRVMPALSPALPAARAAAVSAHRAHSLEPAPAAKLDAAAAAPAAADAAAQAAPAEAAAADPLLDYDPKTWTSEISLHAHSKFSDGDFGPKELAAKLAAAGVRHVALTDHDNVEGQREFVDESLRLGLRPHVGVELTAGKGIHVVMLDFDVDDPKLTAQLKRVQDWRLERAKLYIAHINAQPELAQKGIKLTLEEVLALTANGQIERPDLAEALVRRGAVKDKNEAFEKYLRADVDTPELKRLEPTPAQTMEVVRSAGGLAFLAHPYTIKGLPSPTDLLAMGLHGVEVYRGRIKDASAELAAKIRKDMTQYLAWAKERGLLVMPGADYHGPSHPQTDLAVAMPRALAEPLLKALAPHNLKALRRHESRKKR